MARQILIAACVVVAVSCAGEPERIPPSPAPAPMPPRPYALAGPLIPAATTMVSAWDIPANPLTDQSLDRSPRGETIRLGTAIGAGVPRSPLGATSRRRSSQEARDPIPQQREIVDLFVGRKIVESRRRKRIDVDINRTPKNIAVAVLPAHPLSS
jgi:hypothetical protein